MSCTSPEGVRKIYAARNGFAKSKYYDGSGDPSRMNLFNARDSDAHAKRKRKIGSMYTVSTMTNYETAVDRAIATFHSRFSDFAKEGSIINIPEFLTLYAFDVIGEITVRIELYQLAITY